MRTPAALSSHASLFASLRTAVSLPAGTALSAPLLITNGLIRVLPAPATGSAATTPAKGSKPPKGGRSSSSGGSGAGDEEQALTPFELESEGDALRITRRRARQGQAKAG